ncbi:hypothetical protein CDCA_CDCA05G1563 [Cyanidium caldarium]|uniref:Helicase C-terminal domain-containing protein n=1 Tax=Cyanidium caldarium TaxID=2771 RepID=A0AAV9ITY5_CYACA|nr:hypothetical protein CDCA_CDCA05G1563 [Cyanidium caldarium]
MQHRRQAPPLPATLFGGAQLFFVAATVTRQTVHEAEQLARQVDASRLPMQVVRTARLHQPPADVRVRWMQVHRAPDRVPRLLECLRATADDEPATMIFCNSIDACRFVQHTLAEHGWDSAACHGGLPPPRRRLEFERFVSGTTSRMVCTDVAARGLDLRFLRRVICFDAPRSLSEYLHRIGRLRDGGECVVLLRPAARDQALAESVRQQRRVGERARQVATR